MHTKDSALVYTGGKKEHPGVTQIGAELALPFISDYAKRYGLPVNLDAFDGVEWVGAFYHGGLHGVGGIRDLKEAFPTWRYIYGFYTDGSKDGVPCAHAIGKAMVTLPFGLVGAIHFDNLSMIRVAKRHGFEVTVVPEQKYAYVKRPPKKDILQVLRQGQEIWAKATTAV